MIAAEYYDLRPRPANPFVIKLSRKLNKWINGRDYMLCSYIYLMIKRGEKHGFEQLIYTVSWHTLDGIFMLWSNQEHHCQDCLDYELICFPHLIPKEDLG